MEKAAPANGLPVAGGAGSGGGGGGVTATRGASPARARSRAPEQAGAASTQPSTAATSDSRRTLAKRVSQQVSDPSFFCALCASAAISLSLGSAFTPTRRRLLVATRAGRRLMNLAR